MVTFDEVLPTLVRICETHAGAEAFLALKSAGVVRDLRGRVRLVLDPRPGGPPLDAGALAEALTAELGGFFAPPIWSTQADTRDEARLSGAILDQCAPWEGLAYEHPATGEPQTARQGLWKKLERRLSKQEWLEGTAENIPWPLQERMPAIVTFYSFKGGVGRTTALAACAWQLARAGKRVVVVDLDLEAPGIGTLLAAESDRGVVDVLVDSLATGTSSLEGRSAALEPSAPTASASSCSPPASSIWATSRSSVGSTSSARKPLRMRRARSSRRYGSSSTRS